MSYPNAGGPWSGRPDQQVQAPAPTQQGYGGQEHGNQDSGQNAQGYPAQGQPEQGYSQQGKPQQWQAQQQMPSYGDYEQAPAPGLGYNGAQRSGAAGMQGYNQNPHQQHGHNFDPQSNYGQYSQHSQQSQHGQHGQQQGYGQQYDSYDDPGGYYGQQQRYSGDTNIASMGKRVGAKVIDFLIVGVFSVGIVGSVLFGGYEPTSTSGLYMRVTLPLALVWFLYDFGLNSTQGGTVGMKAMKLRICNEATGEKINLASSGVRSLVSNGVLIIPLGGLFALLVYLSPLFDGSGRRQGWHDKLARTVVIDR